MSVAWVGAAVAVAGAAVKVIDSNKAKHAQQAAIDRANAGLKTEADQARADYAPYRATGEQATTALNGLMKDPNSITSDPGYQFGLSQGVQGIDRSAAGSGSLYSGATLKALDRYGQNYAGTKLNDAYARYGNVAQLGLSAVNGTTNSGQNAQNQISNNLIGKGNVQAASDLANGTAISNGLSQAVAAYTGGGTSGMGSTPFGGTQSQYTPKGSQWGSTWGSQGQDNFFYGNGTSGD
jgi:hypothetical protein